MESKKNNIDDLSKSVEKVGQLYPILVDFHGNIIDGAHRYQVDKNWKKIRLEEIKDKKQAVIVKIVSNVCRRNVSSREKRKILSELGEIYLKEGVKAGDISKRIVEDTGMSYSWVVKYLPKKFKDIHQSTNASLAIRHIAKNRQLTKPSKENVVIIQNYQNTNFINLALNRKLYADIEEVSRRLNTEPTTLITNILISKLKTLKAQLNVCAQT